MFNTLRRHCYLWCQISNVEMNVPKNARQHINQRTSETMTSNFKKFNEEFNFDPKSAKKCFNVIHQVSLIQVSHF